LWAYVRTRFPLWLAASLPLLLVLAALRERVAFDSETAVAFVMALALVLALRLWDDLCDRELDRQVHPERVLCQAASVGPFVGLLVVLIAINFALAMLLRGWWAAAILLGLHALLTVWYALRDRCNWGPVANYHIVLLKYPLIALMLGARTASEIASAPILFSAGAVYLGLCIVEAAHDARLRRLRAARIALAIECLLLAALGCLAAQSAGWLSHWP
jgi:4-hydroxybenzoate polyprenyltransferase